MCMMLVLCVCALSASAWEMYLQDGLEWEEEDVFFGHTYGTNFQVTYHRLIKEKEEGGDIILQEWVTDDPNYSVGLKRFRIKVSGDKVYLFEPTLEEEWTLLYDFSMLPGETREFLSPYLPYSDHYDSVYCVSKEEGEDDGLPRLKMVESKFKDSPYEPRYGHWILGLGNELGIFTKSAYNLSGYIPRIMRNVTLNGALIYAGIRSAAEAPSAESSMAAEYYDMKGNLRQKVDEPGIYVHVRDKSAKKIIVH